MTTPAMTDLDRERAAFEAHLAMISPNTNRKRTPSGAYEAERVESHWRGWLKDRGLEAPAALPQQVVAAGSIDSPEFNDLLYLFGRAFIAGTHEQVVAAGNALIAYIDARQPAPVKPEGLTKDQQDAIQEAANFSWAYGKEKLAETLRAILARQGAKP